MFVLRWSAVAVQLTLPAEYLTGWTPRPSPSATSVQARAAVHALKAEGLGLAAIARRLNATGVSTPTGRGPWYTATVRRVDDPAGHAAYMRAYRARRA